MLKHSSNALTFSASFIAAKAPEFFKRHLWLIIGFMLGYTALEEWNLKLLQLAASHGQDGLLIRLSMVFNSMLIAIFFSLIVPISMHLKLGSKDSLLLIGRKTLPLTIESLRVLVPVLIGYVLLIIPGIYFQVIYSFVFMIVVLDPNYDSDDEFDALKASKQLCKPLWPALLALLLLSFASELAMTYWGGKSSILTDPTTGAVLLIAKTGLGFFFPALLYGLYRFQVDHLKRQTT